ncbi:excinuclease ABC subunit UvrA [Candidatus Uhrbacteria bacterium]|nr:excinuclease ABC subunit UvrA [Candidatus Uhrbacteria bacterium]
MEKIIVRGAKEHNLKNVNLEIPRDKLIVFTGISGSGKSTLAFDTIFAEGQRRYLESLSSYARQFLGQMKKPDVESIDGLSPAISIDQKTASHNPRSTVGTVTEIYDYLRLLYSKIGLPHCLDCGRAIQQLTIDQIVESIIDEFNGQEVMIFSPVVRGRKGEYHTLLNDFYLKGYAKARVNGALVALGERIVLDRYKTHTIDILMDAVIATVENMGRLFEAVEFATGNAEGNVLVASKSSGSSKLSLSRTKKKNSLEPSAYNLEPQTERLYNLKLACPYCNLSFPEIAPRLFSFNSPYGACPTCTGLGIKKEIDPELIIPDKTKTIEEGGILPDSYSQFNYYGSILRSLADHYHLPSNRRIKDLPKETLNAILYGAEDPIPLRVKYYMNGRPRVFKTRFPGLIPLLEERYQKTESDTVRSDIEAYMSSSDCPTCHGARLKPEALAVKVSTQSIVDIAQQSIASAYQFFQTLPAILNARQTLIADRILKEITNRLKFLVNVGLEYLTLSRTANTLAGGEAQRIRLASQVGSALTGVLYVLDEPSIGLHSRDNAKLLETLKHLRDIGNTLIVIEHDEETMREADWLVDIGPRAGKHGGTIIASGPPEQVIKHPTSLTAQYLRGERSIPVPEQRRRPRKNSLIIRGAREHNLKNIAVEIPLGVLVCITGVSGSGKSTLIEDILYPALAKKLHHANTRAGLHTTIEGIEHIDKVIVIDQSPIGRTPRSNPATYTGMFTPIRELFAATKGGRIRGYGPGRFSFNVRGGRCEACQGDGVQKIEMQFLPDVYIPCDVCAGKRYTSETLAITYNDKNIADVLAMTVEEGYLFFKDIPQIADKLNILNDVGLGYIELGQSATTLSGGEAQRIKLATELARRATGRTFYILDEPTTGLHFEDIHKLLSVLERLVDAGNTVLVIEHQLDVVKTADWIIDLGPEGGDKGGSIVAQGTPEQVAKMKQSYTGQFLKPLLKQ